MINHSFVVLAYKDSPYLDKCIESLKNQTIESNIYLSTSTPSEYIDNIAKKYDVKVFVTVSGQGLAHDYNFGLQHTKTKYLTLVHQDDKYMPEYTEKCLRSANKFEDTLICFSDYSELVGDKERSSTLLLNIKLLMFLFFMPFNNNIKFKFWKRGLLSFGCPISAPTVMYNLEKLAGFQFSKDFLCNVDWEAWSYMAKIEGRFVYINKKLLKKRIHLESATTNGLENNLRKMEDYKMFNHFWPKSLARFLMKFYVISYKSNQIKCSDFNEEKHFKRNL
jgi:glycosyltransferase involved in cell wall biosynthesis